jgi:hypothetical protein
MRSESLIEAAAALSDSDLLRRVVHLATCERAATVELVGHLAELDVRKLHLAEGYGSLFAYCTGALLLASTLPTTASKPPASVGGFQRCSICWPMAP